MVKDIIKYNDKEYQLSTVKIDVMFETMIFPIENGIVSGSEVYCFRTLDAGKSCDKHGHIYYHPEKYLSDEAIDKYIKSKEDDFYEEEEIIALPSKYLEKYCLGEIEFDEMIDSIVEECRKLVVEYVAYIKAFGE